MDSTKRNEIIANTIEAFTTSTIVEVNVVSAQDLQQTKWFSSQMRPYAEVWISSKTNGVGTYVQKYGGQNPKWNLTPLEVVCEKELLFSNSTLLNIEVFHRSSKRGRDKHLGTASLFLTNEHYNSEHSKVFTCPLILKNGEKKGSINFTIKHKQYIIICEPSCVLKKDEI